MYKGTGMEKGPAIIIFIAIIGILMMGCTEEEALNNGQEEGAQEETDAWENESGLEEAKDEEENQEDESMGREINEVSKDELQDLEVLNYEIKERWTLSNDEKYILTEIPTAPGTVHQISDFDEWKRDYDAQAELRDNKEHLDSLGVVVPLLSDAMIDPEDTRSTRLENHPIDADLFISTINLYEISPDGKQLLYRAFMYDEEGQHEGPDGISQTFIANFGIPVEPKEMAIGNESFQINPFWSESSEEIYYVLEDGLYSYHMHEDREKLVLPSEDLPGIPREKDEGDRSEIFYDNYRSDQGTYLYYVYEDKIMKVTFGGEPEAEILYEGIEGEEIEEMTVLQEDFLLVSYESGIFNKDDVLLFNGEKIEIEKSIHKASFHSYHISESGDIFLLFIDRDGAEVQIFERDLNKEKAYRLPDSFGHSSVLGEVPGEKGELAVIGEGVYYPLSKE